MKMKNLILFIAASLLSSVAAAHGEGNTKQECTRRCLSADLEMPRMIAYKERLKQIRDKKEAETDPVKRKALEQAESDELERRQDEQEKICHRICGYLRDE